MGHKMSRFHLHAGKYTAWARFCCCSNARSPSQHTLQDRRAHRTPGLTPRVSKSPAAAIRCSRHVGKSRPRACGNAK
jgi:hypothetical protein